MKKINKKLAAACILSVLCAGYSTIGFAAEEKEEKADLQSFALDEYVVTANRTEQTIFDANANISVVTSEDIERMQYDSLDKALTAVPGVQFQNYSGSPALNAQMTAPVMINGSKNVLILIDGVRMTPVGGGDRAINMNLINNMDNIERIEVLKGSAGVLYGSDAAGGVINIITKKGNENKTTLKASRGNFGKKNYHFSNSGTEGVVSWNVYYDKDKKGDYKDGHGKEYENKYDSHAGGINLTTRISDKHEVGIAYNERSSDFRGIDPYDLFKVEDYAKYPGYQKVKGGVDTQDTSLSYELRFDDNTTNKMVYKTERYGLSYFESDQNFGFAKSKDLGYDFKTRLFSNQFTKRFDDKHSMVAGLEFTKSQALDRIYRNKGWQGIKNDSYFAQDTWTFDDKWNMTAGLRYDKAENTINGNKMDDNLSKSLSVGYNFDESKNIYVSFADFFILPNAEQISDRRNNDKIGYYYGNNAIKPAKGKNYSIGYNQKIDDKTSLSVHSFYREFDRDIKYVSYETAEKNEWGRPIYESAWQNTEGSSKDYGFDVQLNKQFDEHWSSFIGYSFLKHTSDLDPDSDRIKLGYLPKHAINLGVNYRNDKLDVGLKGRAILSRDDSESTLIGDVHYGGWPNSHYMILDIGVNYQATKNVKLFAVANNLLDVWYAESAFQPRKDWFTGELIRGNGDIYGMPGRSFVAGVEVSF